MKKQQGFSLVIVLLGVVVLAIIFVAFATNMGFEQRISSNAAAAQMADLHVRSAVSHAMGLLEANIPRPVPPGESTQSPTAWATSPGLLLLHQGQSTEQRLPLSTNPNAEHAPQNTAANLNQRLSDGTFPIIPSGEPLRVEWRNVTADINAGPSADNPIVARYAFWIDDESTKISVNTAQGKPTQLRLDDILPAPIENAGDYVPLSHPASVSINALDAAYAPSSIAAQVRAQGPFLSLTDFAAFAGGSTSPRNLGWEATTYNASPEFNVFGKSRLFFRRRTIVGEGRMLGRMNPLQTGAAFYSSFFPAFQWGRDRDGFSYFHGDEGRSSTRDPHIFFALATQFANILQRNDWPAMPPRSFVDKWGGGDSAIREADQVAWNLLVFGNFGDFEFPNKIREIRSYGNLLDQGEGALLTGGSFSTNRLNARLVKGPLSQKAMLPNFPSPLLNELGFTAELLETSLGSGQYKLALRPRFELWNPPNYPAFRFDTASPDYNDAQLSIRANRLVIEVSDGSTSIVQTPPVNPDINDGLANFRYNTPSPTSLAPDSFLVADGEHVFYPRNGAGALTTNQALGATFNGPVEVKVSMRVYLRNQQTPIQVAPIWDSSAGVEALNPPAGHSDLLVLRFRVDPGLPSIASIEVPDPRLAQNDLAWKNSDPIGENPETVFSEGNSFGAPNGETTPDIVSSLGFPTADASAYPSSPWPSRGYLSFLPIGMQRAIPGATLTLGPSPNKADLPDWLLLDLLAPTIASRTLAEANAGTPAISVMNRSLGMVNLNTIRPGLAAHAQFPDRRAAIQGLLEGYPNGAEIAENILNDRRSGQRWVSPGLFLYPGELCEIEGLADRSIPKFQREALIRQLANVVTTQSNTFTVWGRVQVVKKIPANSNPGLFESGDLILAERMFRVLVERHVWPGRDGLAGYAEADPGTGGFLISNLSQGRTQPGLAPTYGSSTSTGPAWELLDGPHAPNYMEGPWNHGVRYEPTTLKEARNPVGAHMSFRVIETEFLQ
jgi:type II secretory pathway pseudopilin PulG